MDSIPIRLTPQPGEALDSYLETYAALLHVTVGDILRLGGPTALSNLARAGKGHKPWVHYLDPVELAELSAVAAVAASTLAGMTLAHYHGTGLVTIDPATRRPARSRWWRQSKGSRFCPACLADNDGRWMLSWRLPWSFACTSHLLLLADTCPACDRRHRWTRPPQPGHCGITTTAFPDNGRATEPTCAYALAQAPALPLDPDGPVLRAQRRVEATISAILRASGDPAGSLAPLHAQLDDTHAAARAALSALRAPATPPPQVNAVLADLGGRDGCGLPSRGQTVSSGNRHPTAAHTAFAVATADLMLGDHPGDPDPAIAAWLVDVAVDRAETGPVQMLNRWKDATPELQGALLKHLGPRLRAAYQLRYGTATNRPSRPATAAGATRAAAVPRLFWRGWALRLNPAGMFAALPYRATLSAMLLTAGTTDISYPAAQALLGQAIPNSAGSNNVTQRLRHAGALDAVLDALGQLARELDEHPAPIDYARRRRRRTFYRTDLDSKPWRECCRRIRRRNSPRQERFARLYLIELLTGDHPCFLPAPVTPTAGEREDYDRFAFGLPEPLAAHLNLQAQRVLRRAGIDEPVGWEPPFDWVTAVTWPGPHPDSIPADDLWALTPARLTRTALAARLNTSVEHVRVLAYRHPAPWPQRRHQRHQPAPAQDIPADLPTGQQLRDYVEQGHGSRKIAQLSRCPPRLITQALTAAGLARPTRAVLAGLDPDWLRHQYEHEHRTFADLAADLGIHAADLSAHARKLNITRRSGAAAHKHPLADHGGPRTYPPAIWAAFTGHHAELRLRRLMATPGHPDLTQAAKHIGTKRETLTAQITRIEQAAGATLLHHAPAAGGITWTPAGEQFAHEIQPILDLLDQARTQPTTQP